MTVERDPVCGMLVEVDAPYARAYRGSTFRFCSHACLERFERDPTRFVEESDEAEGVRSREIGQ